MQSTITAEKAALRRAIKEFYLTPEEKCKSDRKLIERLLSLPQVARARCLLLFYGTGREPDTAPLLQALTAGGRTAALPACLPGGEMEARRYQGPEHLVPGPFGIPQCGEDCPVLPPEAFDVILVPNLCCDRQGHRLGHGGGYYDRYLPQTRAFKIALCRDVLLQASLPVQPHDAGMDLILTETQCLSHF